MRLYKQGKPPKVPNKLPREIITTLPEHIIVHLITGASEEGKIHITDLVLHVWLYSFSTEVKGSVAIDFSAIRMWSQDNCAILRVQIPSP